MGTQEHAPMLAAILRTFFHYTPRREKYLGEAAPHRHHVTTYVKKNSPKSHRTTDFVKLLGKLG